MPRKSRIYNGFGMVGSPPDFQVDQEGNLAASLVSQLNVQSQGLVRKLNGHLSFGNGQPSSNAGNFDAVWIDFLTPSVADTQFAVYHPLGRLPAGVGVWRQDAAAILYDLNIGGWNVEKIYFGCDVGSITFRILLV